MSRANSVGFRRVPLEQVSAGCLVGPPTALFQALKCSRSLGIGKIDIGPLFDQPLNSGRLLPI
jgi:hypothetical protein